MAEIIAEPTALSKVIPLKFKINDVDVPKTTQLSTNKQFNTTDTDAWFSFELDGLASTNGTYDLTLINLDDKSIFHHDNVLFAALPFHYRLNSSEDITLNEIRHAGRWIGQLVVTMGNGDTTSRQFGFNIAGHILDGQDAQVILLSDYQALINTINLAKDDLAQYNIDYSALIADVTTAEGVREQAEIDRAAVFATLVDSEMVAQNVATKLAEKEATFAPRMLSLESELVETNAQVDLLNRGLGETFTTLVALQTAYPTGDTKDHIVAADGHRYYWNDTAWADGGAYQAVETLNGSITPIKTTFFKTGKNLFNKDAVKTGFKLNSIGLEIADKNYSVSDYIHVAPNTAYFGNYAFPYTCYYDENKNFISSVSSVMNTSYVTPLNAKYVRFTIYNVYLLTTQIELGAVGTSYENFYFKIDKDLVEDKDIEIDYKNTDFVVTGKNLFNKSLVTNGYFVSPTTGVLSANAIYSSSEFIDALSIQNYILTLLTDCRMAFYNENKAFISGVYPVTNPITTPANTAYIRFSVKKAQLDLQQLELGSVKTALEPFGYRFAKELPQKHDFQLFLPSEICIAVGRTIEIYNKQVACVGNIENYHFKWVCAVGKSMKRKWTYTAVAEKIGEYPLSLTVYDNDMNEVGIASTTVKIVDSVITNPVNLLSIGDSLTNGKAWLGELKTLSANKISYVGTRTFGVPVSEGHEGRSGVTSAWYLANSAYTFDSYFDGSGADGTKNPFWNPATSSFDYAYYKTTYGKNPNAVQLFLGTNGITLDPTANANSIKGIVDGIRQTDANVPIFVVFTLYRGDQNGIGKQLSTDGYSAGSGVWKLEEDRKVFNLMVKLNELLNGYSGLHFIPISLCHDSEYNFGQVETPVNPRSSITEPQPTEATHTQTEGYLQMADIMFSTMAKYLS